MMVYVWQIDDADKRIKLPGKPCKFTRVKDGTFDSVLVVLIQTSVTHQIAERCHRHLYGSTFHIFCGALTLTLMLMLYEELYKRNDESFLSDAVRKWSSLLGKIRVSVSLD